MSYPHSPEMVERIRDLRYGDGMTLEAVSALTGASLHSVGKYAPGRPGKVPVGPVRAVFEASGKSAASVAAEIGWLSPQNRRNGDMRTLGDSSRLRRRLGITAESWGHGTKRTTGHAKMIDAEAAGLIAEACGQPAWSVMPDEDSVAA